HEARRQVGQVGLGPIHGDGQVLPIHLLGAPRACLHSTSPPLSGSAPSRPGYPLRRRGGRGHFSLASTALARALEASWGRACWAWSLALVLSPKARAASEAATWASAASSGERTSKGSTSSPVGLGMASATSASSRAFLASSWDLVVRSASAYQAWMQGRMG